MDTRIELYFSVQKLHKRDGNAQHRILKCHDVMQVNDAELLK